VTPQVSTPEPRLSVALTFDHDAISSEVSRGDGPVKISRGEFGPRVGVPRILALLERHGIPATFFVPGHTLATFPESVASIVALSSQVHGSPAGCALAPVAEPGSADDAGATDAGWLAGPVLGRPDETALPGALVDPPGDVAPGELLELQAPSKTIAARATLATAVFVAVRRAIRCLQVCRGEPRSPGDVDRSSRR